MPVRHSAEANRQPAGNMMGHRGAHPYFEIVRMRSEDEQVDRRHRHSPPGTVLDGARYVPLRPPLFVSNRTRSITMPRSAALSMS